MDLCVKLLDTSSSSSSSSVMKNKHLLNTDPRPTAPLLESNEVLWGSLSVFCQSLLKVGNPGLGSRHGGCSELVYSCFRWVWKQGIHPNLEHVRLGLGILWSYQDELPRLPDQRLELARRGFEVSSLLASWRQALWMVVDKGSTPELDPVPMPSCYCRSASILDNCFASQRALDATLFAAHLKHNLGVRVWWQAWPIGGSRQFI